MKTIPVALFLVLGCLTACNKSAAPSSSTTPATSPMSSAAAAPTSSFSGAVQQKLKELSGSGAADCGLFGVKATSDQLKTASDCATQAGQGKKAFYVAYDMPGMAVGVAENSAGKLFTVQSQGGALSSGDCPSALRVASSGRVTCFAPGDMSSMSGSHTAGSMPAGMPNPHSSESANPHGTGQKKN